MGLSPENPFRDSLTLSGLGRDASSPRSQPLMFPPSHDSIFSKVWLTVLGIMLTIPQFLWRLSAIGVATTTFGFLVVLESAKIRSPPCFQVSLTRWLGIALIRSFFYVLRPFRPARDKKV